MKFHLVTIVSVVVQCQFKSRISSPVGEHPIPKRGRVPPHSVRPIVAHLPLSIVPQPNIRTYLIRPLTVAFHLITRFINVYVSLQMVQAIQVLRFHLLELEKVSTIFFIPTDKAEYIRSKQVP